MEVVMFASGNWKLREGEEMGQRKSILQVNLGRDGAERGEKEET